MSINTEEFRAAPIDYQAQYQSDLGLAQDWRSAETSAAPAGNTVTDLVGDISLAMRQFYQSPARSLG
jgi:hypothetical protein